MQGIELANPLALCLLPLPLGIMFLFKATPQPDAEILLPSSIKEKLLSKTQNPDSFFLSNRMIVAMLAWLGIILGFSGPRVANSDIALPETGRDIMLSIDLSGSMTTRDFDLDNISITRLELVKKVASELVLRREGDRIGLVIFAEKALAAAPLTFDNKAIAHTLDEMEVGLVGRSTAIGEGLGLALKRLMTSQAQTRIVILLSDGANNAGSTDPEAVADLARSLGVKIFTIGLGVEDTLSHPESRDAVDFVSLQKVADIGGGAAFRARSGAELDQVMRMIESMATSLAPAPPVVIYTELWIYPAIIALISCISIIVKARTMR